MVSSFTLNLSNLSYFQLRIIACQSTKSRRLELLIAVLQPLSFRRRHHSQFSILVTRTSLC